DHDVAETGERDDDDEQDRDGGHEAERRAELVARDLRERAAVAPRARDQDDEVLRRAPEDDAEEDPQEPRVEAELRREDRADERAGPADGGEMVTEEHPAIRDVEVLPV